MQYVPGSSNVLCSEVHVGCSRLDYSACDRKWYSIVHVQGALKVAVDWNITEGNGELLSREEIVASQAAAPAAPT